VEWQSAGRELQAYAVGLDGITDERRRWIATVVDVAPEPLAGGPMLTETDTDFIPPNVRALAEWERRAAWDRPSPEQQPPAPPHSPHPTQ